MTFIKSFMVFEARQDHYIAYSDLLCNTIQCISLNCPTSVFFEYYASSRKAKAQTLVAWNKDMESVHCRHVDKYSKLLGNLLT